jgi:hypothetical protein
MTNTAYQLPELLSEQHVNRSAYVVKTARPTRIYLGVCEQHDRPVRFEVEDDSAVAKRMIPCTEGGHLIEGELLVAVTTKLECDGSCMSASRNFCACGCGGANHGKRRGPLLGESEQLDSALDKWRTKRRQVQVKREQRAQAAERKQRQSFEAWAEENRELIGSLVAQQEHEDANPFLCDLALQVTTGRNGNGPKALSEGQVLAATRVLKQYEDRVRQIAQRKANAKPCPIGRVQISGEIVKVKVEQDNFTCYDKWQFKATVACHGFAVFVTIPSEVLQWVRTSGLFELEKGPNYGDFSSYYTRHPDFCEISQRYTRMMRGIELTFTATITRSERDESFGFGKRPSKVSYSAPAAS